MARSLNGPRATELIRLLVPESKYVDADSNRHAHGTHTHTLTTHTHTHTHTHTLTHSHTHTLKTDNVAASPSILAFSPSDYPVLV